MLSGCVDAIGNIDPTNRYSCSLRHRSDIIGVLIRLYPHYFLLAELQHNMDKVQFLVFTDQFRVN